MKKIRLSDPGLSLFAFVLANARVLYQFHFLHHESAYEELTLILSDRNDQLILQAGEQRLEGLLSIVEANMFKVDTTLIEKTELLVRLLSMSTCAGHMTLRLLRLLLLAKVHTSDLSGSLNDALRSIPPASEEAEEVCIQYYKTALSGEPPDLASMKEFIQNHSDVYGEFAVLCLDALGKTCPIMLESVGLFFGCSLHAFIACVRVMHSSLVRCVKGKSRLIIRLLGNYKYNPDLELLFSSPNPKDDKLLYDFASLLPEIGRDDQAAFIQALQLFFSVLYHGHIKTLETLSEVLGPVLADAAIKQKFSMQVRDLLLRMSLIKDIPVSYLLPVVDRITSSCANGYTTRETMSLLLHLQKQWGESEVLPFTKKYTDLLFEEVEREALPEDQTLPSLNELRTIFEAVCTIGGAEIRNYIEQKRAVLRETAKKKLNVSETYALLSIQLFTFNSFAQPDVPSDFQGFLDAVIARLEGLSWDQQLFRIEERPRISLCETPTIDQLTQELKQSLIAVIDSKDFSRYLDVFKALRDSCLPSFLRSASSHHIYIAQLIVSYLRRLFIADIEKISPDYISDLESQAIRLHFAPVEKPMKTRLELAHKIYNSLAVRRAFEACNLQPVEFDNWKRKVFYAPLVDVHGITVFGATVLIRSDYALESPQSLLAFIVTLLHESAHVSIKESTGFYEVEALTPLSDPSLKSELYEIGQIGTPPSSDPKDFIPSSGDHGESGIKLEVKLFGKMVASVTRNQLEYLIESDNWEHELQQFQEALVKLSGGSPLELISYGRTQQQLIYLGRDNHSKPSC